MTEHIRKPEIFFDVILRSIDAPSLDFKKLEEDDVTRINTYDRDEKTIQVWTTGTSWAAVYTKYTNLGFEVKHIQSEVIDG